MSIHETAARRYRQDYQMRALREKLDRAPSWLREKILRTSRRSAMRRAAHEALKPDIFASLPRLGLDSGRSGSWFLGLGCDQTQHKSWGWWRYAAARRSLAMAGYAGEAARMIAQQAAACDRCAFVPGIDGEIPEPPATAHEANCYGWDVSYWDGSRMVSVARTPVDAEKVRRWTGWLGALSNDQAPIGRRMRRWISACVRHQQAERSARAAKAQASQQEYLAALPASTRAIYQAGSIRPGCIHIHGTTVTEALHDVGGSMTFLNQLIDRDALAARQAQHDDVYHSGTVGWWPTV